MNSNDTTPDDSHWSSLAQELGLDSEPSPSVDPPRATPLEVHPVERLAPDLDLPDAMDDEDTSIEPNLNNEAFAEGEGPPGEGGKRKRKRRRRRRKGGPQTEGGAAGDDENADEGEEAGEGEETEELLAEPQAPDLLRDVIASWNVPAWEDLIGGLYRPGN